MKADYNMPQDLITNLLKMVEELASDALHNVPKNYYETNKLLSQLGLHREIIDCCRNSCMLYYKGDANLREYRFCSESRYKVRVDRDNCMKE